MVFARQAILSIDFVAMVNSSMPSLSSSQPLLLVPSIDWETGRIEDLPKVVRGDGIALLKAFGPAS